MIRPAGTGNIEFIPWTILEVGPGQSGFGSNTGEEKVKGKVMTN